MHEKTELLLANAQGVSAVRPERAADDACTIVASLASAADTRVDTDTDPQRMIEIIYVAWAERGRQPQVGSRERTFSSARSRGRRASFRVGLLVDISRRGVVEAAVRRLCGGTTSAGKGRSRHDLIVNSGARTPHRSEGRR